MCKIENAGGGAKLHHHPKIGLKLRHICTVKKSRYNLTSWDRISKMVILLILHFLGQDDLELVIVKTTSLFAEMNIWYNSKFAWKKKIA